MADTEKSRRGEANPGKLYTLSEVAKKTGISMPTLQRYKKSYQSRIPSTGTGRKQRYPEGALAIFEEIKNENLGKRGRPRKDAAEAAAPKRGRKVGSGRPAAKAPRGRQAGSQRGRKAAAAPGRGRKPASGLLTLTEVGKMTGISYPTLVRYVKLYSGKLPHEGTGRARRFQPEAVEVFKQLRQESGRGGRKKGSGGGLLAAGRAAVGGAVSSRLKAIEASQKKLEKNFRGLVKSLQKLFK